MGGGGFPTEWRAGMITPLYKKGDKEESKNYSGITLMDTGYKIYAEIIREKMEKILEGEEKLDETEMWFRKGRGTADAMLIMNKSVEVQLKKKGGKVYAFFADMRTAFDKVKRKKICEMMKGLGQGERISARVKEIYRETSSTLRVEDRIIGGFDTYKGVRQGCPLSPTLFNVAMADTEKEMSKVQDGGMVLGKKKF